MKKNLIYGMIIFLLIGCNQGKKDWEKANCICIFSKGMGVTHGKTNSSFGSGMIVTMEGSSYVPSVLTGDKPETSTNRQGMLGASVPMEPVVYIWRDFAEEEVATAKKIGLKPGQAYIKDKDMKYRAIQKVDLSKSDKEICTEFGIK
jgi:hypothetical protein